MRFSGKRAVVTGGASGIGRATALRLADEGATVLIGDIDETGGHAIADASGGRILFQRTDVLQAGDIEALMQTADDAGGLDLRVPVVVARESTAATVNHVNTKHPIDRGTREEP